MSALRERPDALVVIDEAQHMSDTLLECVRGQDGIVALAVRAMDELDTLDAAIMRETKRTRETDHAEP